MRFHKKPVVTAVSLALIGLAYPAMSFAQAAPTAEEAKKAEDAKKAAAKKTEQIETVIVTGIRASLQKSIDVKKEADTNVEVVTADDVGKMPDKNIADALSRLTGVNVQYGGALAMDEAERVAIRGTSPNLNLVTVNGHALSSGDWHVGDQAGSGRSVGFGLMPSQLIGQAIVYKTGRADITEGGIAGTVDILTRKPLDFRKSITGEVSIGAVYADLPKKTDPQASGLIAWKSEDSKFGAMVQGFSEKRHLRRDGQEIFGYNYITQAQANASGIPALVSAAQAAAAISPTAVTNVRMPGSLNSAMFEGVRERTGGYFGAQWKPTANLDLNFSAFASELKADNYNSSGYGLPNTLLNNGWQIQNGVVDNGVLVGASLVRPANAAATQRVVGFQFDHFLREGAKSKSNFFDLDGKWSVTDNLSFKGRVGSTEGSGVTNSQPSIVLGIINPNITYRINAGNAVDYSITNAAGANFDLTNTTNFVQLSNQGASVNSNDKEKYAHVDGEYKLDAGMFRNIKFGARSSKHTRTYDVIGARWNAQDNANGTPVTPSPFISVTGGLLVTNIVGSIPIPATLYPSNWASGISGNFPRSLMRYNTSQLQNLTNQYVNWDPVKGKQWSAGFEVKENNDALYLMTEFEHDKISGNIGVRAATTEVTSKSYQALPNGTGPGQCVPGQPCSVPNAIVGSLFATYVPQVVNTKHTDWLPSLNLRWEIEPKLIGRLGLTKTLGRANYNELAGAVTLNNTLLTGTSGNPLLKPITSTNADVSLAYYFDRRAYVSGAVFAQDIKDYVKPGVSNVEYFNTATGTNSIYLVTSRVQVKAKIKGLELAGEMPIGGGFGVLANATYVDGKDADGLPFLGTSRMTYNLQGYYEDDVFSARLAWNHRSDYAIGLTAQPGVISSVGTHRYASGGSLSTSLSYKITPNISLTLDGNNLLNPVRNTYYITENAPGYWHEFGRQFFLNLRAKF
jgi:iron complex outermembrane recepter protein